MKHVVAVATIMSAVALGAAPAAQAAYGSPETVATGISNPTGIAVDHAGDLFVSEGASGEVVQLSPSAQGYTQSVAASGFDDPTGVAVDGEGNLFVGEFDPSLGNPDDGTVQEVFNDYAQSQLLSGLGSLNGVAVDTHGNVFADDRVNGEIDESSVSGATSSTPVAGCLEGMAADASGDQFVISADCNGNDANADLVEVLPDGSQNVVAQFTVVGNPDSVSVDAAGDLFVGYFGTPSRDGSEGQPGSVVEYTPSSGGGYSESQIATGLTGVQAVTVDASGNVFVAESGTVVEIPYLGDTTSTQESCGPQAPAGQAQTCTVTVSDTESPASVPTGTVTFSANGSGTFGNSNSGCVLSGGSCSISYTPSSAGEGSQTITADYDGTPSYESSGTTATLQITALTPVVQLTCAKPTTSQTARVNRGEPIALPCVATVRRPAGSPRATPIPTGTVGWTVNPSQDPGEELMPGTCTLKASSGLARCQTTLVTATPDTYTVIAQYSGDRNYVQGGHAVTVTVS